MVRCPSNGHPNPAVSSLQINFATSTVCNSNNACALACLGNGQENHSITPVKPNNASPCVGAFERTKRDDPERVDVLMRPEIMCFDVMPMARFFDAWQIDHSLYKCL